MRLRSSRFAAACKANVVMADTMRECTRLRSSRFAAACKSAMVGRQSDMRKQAEEVHALAQFALRCACTLFGCIVAVWVSPCARAARALLPLAGTAQES